MSEKSPRFFTPAFAITAEQRRIQSAASRYTIVEANAGAAKTTTLALCVCEALARRVPPEQILVLTFTPQACGVFKSRLVELGLPHAVVSLLPIQTFDAFATSILASYHNGRACGASHQRLCANTLCRQSRRRTRVTPRLDGM